MCVALAVLVRFVLLAPMVGAVREMMFVITVGIGSVLINGLNQPLLFTDEETAQAYLEKFVAEHEGDYRNDSLRVQKCHIRSFATL